MLVPRSLRRARLAALVSVAIATTGLLLAPRAAEANPAGTSLVISEVYGGGGNSGATYTNDFVELYNPTNAAISLTGMSLQYRSAASTAVSTNVASLNAAGSVPAHDWFVVTLASGGANGVAVPNVDFAGAAVNMSATSGQIYLASSLTGIDADGAGNTSVSDPAVIDFVGFGSPAIKEGATAAPSPSATSSIARNASGADTDANGADFTVANPMHPGAGTSALALASLPDQSGAVGTPVSVSFASAASGGVTPYHWSASNLPDGLTIDPATGGVTGTPTTATSYATQVTVQDSAGTPASASRSFTWVITATLVVTPIDQIQGTTDISPMVGQTVTTEGKVTATYPTGGLNGFYVQSTTPDDPAASDAILVFAGSGFTAFPAIGDSVQVRGTVSEFNGLTELTIATNGDVVPVADLGSVPVKTDIPETGCAVGACPTTVAALNAARESSEGELFQPTAPWTATDVYDGAPLYNDGSNATSNFGEIGLAADSSTPLVAPTEIIDAQNTAQIAAQTQWSNAHRIILDDGSSRNYSTTNKDDPAPWQTLSYVPRVGAAVTFPAPVVLTWGFNMWRVEPTTMVNGAPDVNTQPQFSQTRAANAAPQDVGGDLRLATFNVLNFFPTDGAEYVAAGGGNVCSFFNDRAGNPITTNQCGNPTVSSGNGPRGAADQTNVARQRDKIVAAINTANADIVSLEELENSAKFGKSRDFAIGVLVDALNAASSPGKWAFAPSPTGPDLPPLSDEDVIRTGFIYQPAHVSLVGASKILVGSAAFANAREPLAQAFKRTGSADSSAFAVIVNHFKSKGSGVDDGTGQGNANPDRIAQAHDLVTFADQFLTERGLTKMFLVGDFNAYSQEDPVQVLTGAGYAQIDSTSDPSEETYNFDGQIGSLDHVFANAAASPDVTGADVWPINGYESVYYEYSRYNYNATNLYDTSPFRSSDHSPEIVGIDAGPLVTSVSAPDVSVEYGLPAPVQVTVTGGGTTPSGSVQLRNGATVLGSGVLAADGTATISVPARSLPPGSYPLQVVYSGDADHLGSTGTTTLTVDRASSAVAATTSPTQPKVGQVVSLTVTVTGAHGVQATGQVTVTLNGGTPTTANLVGGVSTVSLGRFTHPGTQTVVVRYLGSSLVNPSTSTVTIDVRKRP